MVREMKRCPSKSVTYTAWWLYGRGREPEVTGNADEVTLKLR